MPQKGWSLFFLDLMKYRENSGPHSHAECFPTLIPRTDPELEKKGNDGLPVFVLLKRQSDVCHICIQILLQCSAILVELFIILHPSLLPKI